MVNNRQYSNINYLQINISVTDFHDPISVQYSSMRMQLGFGYGLRSTQ